MTMTHRPDFLDVGSRYVALGSSFAAGPGIPSTIDVPCARSDQNYPHRIAAALELDLTDVTCSGATIDDVLSIQQSALLEAAPPRPRQIDAVLPDTRLVTITIGANDVEYLSALCTWSDARMPGRIPPAYAPFLLRPVDRDRMEDRLAIVSDLLEDVVTAVHSHAPDAVVVLVDYATILPPEGTHVGAVPITPEQQTYLWHVATSLEDATARAASATGARLVTVSEASRTHFAGSLEPWVSGFEFLGGTAAYHPTSEGHQAMARLVLHELGLRFATPIP